LRKTALFLFLPPSRPALRVLIRQKNQNFRRLKMQKYYININGQAITVSQEIYRVYVSMAEHERYLERKDRANGLLPEMPEEKRIYSGKITSPVEQQVFQQWQAEQLYIAISRLDKNEQWLIGELYFAEKSQSQISRELKIPRRTLCYRTNQALKKLRAIMNSL
jgi:DNA-directed RNA polymerase specialized sigma subunit